MASARDLSVVYASYAAAKLAAQIPGGVWVDHKGSRAVLVVALVTYIASLVAFLAPFGTAWFACVRALEGLATGLVYPAVFARVLLASEGEHAGRRLGTAVGIGSSGLLVGPVLGALLGNQGMALPIGVVATLATLVLVMAILDRKAPQQTDAGRAPRTTAGEIAGLLNLARDRAFVATMLPIAFNKLTFSAFQGLLPLVGAEIFGLGATGVALLFVLVGVVFAMAQPFGGVLVDRFPARRVVVLALPALIGALAALALPSGVTVFAIFFALHIFAQSVVFVATMTHAATAHASASTYGGVFGLLSTFTDTMTVAGPLAFLNLYGLIGRATFAAMAVVGVLFAVPFCRGLRLSSEGSAKDSGNG